MKTILLLICLFMIFGVVSAFNTGNWYYAYGDSITRATGYGDLPTDGSANYVLQMRDTHDPCALAERNTDGSAQWSGWGWVTESSHVNFTSGQVPEGKRPVVIYMFGVNDQIFGYSTPQQYAVYIIYMKRYFEGNGSYSVPVLPTLIRNGTYNMTYGNQSAYIHDIEVNLTRNNIWYVRGYDAVDTIPGNGQLDQFNQTNYAEGLHLNVTGHRALGEYVWQKLQERDKA